MESAFACPSCGGTSDLKADRCVFCGNPFISNLGPGIGASMGVAAARKTVALLEAKLAKAPKNGQAFLELGRAYHQLGEYPKAEEALAKAAALLPQKAEAFLLLAWNTGIMRGWEKAGVAQNAGQALAIEPELAQAKALLHLSRGMSEYLFDRSIKHSQLALKEFLAAVEADPKNTYGYFMAGCVCEELDEPKLAADYLRKAADLALADDAPGREDARIFARAGRAYHKLNDRENAKKYLSTAVKLDPANEAARSILSSLDHN